MAAKGGERTASSATRFTATTPHASSKLASGAAKAPTSRFTPVPGQGGPKKVVGSGGSSLGAETPEQRVARLRAAHNAAKNAKISRFDSILARARPFFDSAHRITVMGLVGLTGMPLGCCPSSRLREPTYQIVRLTTLLWVNSRRRSHDSLHSIRHAPVQSRA